MHKYGCVHTVLLLHPLRQLPQPRRRLLPIPRVPPLGEHSHAVVKGAGAQRVDVMVSGAEHRVDGLLREVVRYPRRFEQGVEDQCEEGGRGGLQILILLGLAWCPFEGETAVVGDGFVKFGCGRVGLGSGLHGTVQCLVQHEEDGMLVIWQLSFDIACSCPWTRYS